MGLGAHSSSCQTEVCGDGIDNDCDGNIDEGCPGIIASGLDLFTSPGGGSTVEIFAGPNTIPAGFFGPGSDPFIGTVVYGGQPLNTNPFGAFGPADTVVKRMDAATLPAPGSSDTVPIEIVALHLQSVQPIVVTYGGTNPEPWNVRVNLNSTEPQPVGSMEITRDSCALAGGTFSSTLPVLPRLTFTRVGPPSTKVLEPAQPLVFQATGHWKEADPGNLGLVSADPGASVDHDGEPGTPMKGPQPGTSNFHMGLRQLTCPVGGCTGPVTKRMTQEDALLAKHGVLPAQICPNGDTDSDGICDDADNCPTVANPLQPDADNDGIGDACDNCVNVCNVDQANFDGDALGDACDPDIDGDGVPNGADLCPATPVGQSVNADGCSCAQTPCQNGGNCNPDGTCTCLPGYSGYFCEIPPGPTTGACCTDGFCTNGVTPAACGSGTFMGFGTTCTTTSCPCPPGYDRCGPSCEAPDNGGGTANFPTGCDYGVVDDLWMIIDGLPPGTTIEIDNRMGNIVCDGVAGVCTMIPQDGDCAAPGGSLGGEKSCRSGTFHLEMQGTGTLLTFVRTKQIPMQMEVHSAPRTPGTSPQVFACDLSRMFGQITGDPDFDLLRVTAGTDYGMPSPGHTTLTQRPGGTWAVDSFFDITYRIDFVGKAGGPLAGRSGSTTGTIRMSTGGGCVDLQTNPNHCGTCGIVCNDGNPCTTDSCVAGVCTFTPIPGCCSNDSQCNFPNGTCVSGTCQCAPGYIGAQCQTPVGACCFDGYCESNVEGPVCANNGGTFLGAASTCTPNTCACPSGQTRCGPSCAAPDNGGTAVYPPDSGASCAGGMDWPTGAPLMLNGLPPGEPVLAGPGTRMRFSNVVEQPAVPEGINSFFDVFFDIEMRGAGYLRQVTVACPGSQSHAGNHGTGTTQNFNTEMLALQGQLPPGDPDFDLLRVTAGTNFGMPSPGHTTLTRLPGGNWAVDSFFDITYRVDFVGAPGGPFAGKSGSTTGTIRMSTGGGCVDLQTNPNHCGTCGNTCQNGGTCSGGGCVCPEGYSGPDCSTPPAGACCRANGNCNLVISPAACAGPDETFHPGITNCNMVTCPQPTCVLEVTCVSGPVTGCGPGVPACGAKFSSHTCPVGTCPVGSIYREFASGCCVELTYLGCSINTFPPLPSLPSCDGPCVKKGSCRNLCTNECTLETATACAAIPNRVYGGDCTFCPPPTPPVNCDDGNPCTLDECDPLTGNCSHTNLPAGTPCGPDPTPCTRLVCDGAGGCVVENKPYGTPCGADPSPCERRVCDGNGNCIIENKPDGTACDDGNPCTGPDTCTGGVCSGPLNYNPATHCCDPTNGNLTVIDDGNACTDDVCNPDGTVSHTPNYNTATHCCNPATGGLTLISDGNACTDDVCNPLTGVVTHTNTTPAGMCCNPADGTLVPISDGNACTDDACNPLTGVVTHTPNYNAATHCCNPANGTTTVIDDGDPCTTDSCNSLTGAVTHTQICGACCNGTTCSGPVTQTACEGGGGTFQGIGSSCTPTNPCAAAPTVAITVELGPTVDPTNGCGPYPRNITRCIDITFYQCTPSVMTHTWSGEITFRVNATPGVNPCSPVSYDPVVNTVPVDINLPTGNWYCAIARDRLHTLARKADLTGGPAYAVAFTGGRRLPGGNLNNDSFIDILDFGAWAGQYLMQYMNGDTDCMTQPIHADMSGDGKVDSGDFTFIAINFLMVSDDSCCPSFLVPGDPFGARPRARPVTSITVDELRRRGMGAMAAGDVNDDGVLDSADVADVMMGQMPRARPDRNGPVSPDSLNPGRVNTTPPPP